MSVKYQENLPHAQSFQDLLAYQVTMEMQQKIFEMSKGFPREETYSLTDQIRRSSRSVGAQIAEAWGKRRYEAHFISKLTDAESECLETLHWLETARRCCYLTDQQAADLTAQYDRLGRLIAGMIAKASAFCGKPSPRQIRETAAEYFTNHD
ncbi:MAG: four helix bundle protein [Anaerolineales bacterium]